MRNLSVLVCLGIVHSAALALDLPRDHRVPGGVAVVSLGPIVTATPPAARFEDRPVLVLADNREWKAVIGLALGLVPGRYRLHTGLPQETRVIEFSVAPKQYRIQRLTLKDQRQVDPTPEDLRRIGNEKKEIEQAFLHWSEASPPSLLFEFPARGRLSSEFGLRRFFNGQARAPHSGLDIAAPTGTPVTAPTAGRVLVVGDYFFNGKTVFLDHGQGLVTMYNHLNRISVTPGDRIARGETIGEIGLTGRTTGAHLHWSVSLNNARVDPVLFVAESGARDRGKKPPGVSATVPASRDAHVDPAHP